MNQMANWSFDLTIALSVGSQAAVFPPVIYQLGHKCLHICLFDLSTKLHKLISSWKKSIARQKYAFIVQTATTASIRLFGSLQTLSPNYYHQINSIWTKYHSKFSFCHQNSKSRKKVPNNSNFVQRGYCWHCNEAWSIKGGLKFRPTLPMVIWKCLCIPFRS